MSAVLVVWLIVNVAALVPHGLLVREAHRDLVALRVAGAGNGPRWAARADLRRALVGTLATTVFLAVGLIAAAHGLGWGVPDWMVASLALLLTFAAAVKGANATLDYLSLRRFPNSGR